MLLGLSVQRSVKSVRRRAKRTYYVERDVSTVSNRTEREDMVISQDDHTLYLLCTAALSRTHRCRRGLHGVVAAFTLSVFSSVFAPGS